MHPQMSPIFVRLGWIRLLFTVDQALPGLALKLSQRPSDPNHPYCHYCEESTYHEYDPYFHAWVCQTCFGGMIRVDKKDPLSAIRAELNSLALHVAKSGYNAEVKGKLRDVAGRIQKLAESS